jgi:hypothetical protein
MSGNDTARAYEAELHADAANRTNFLAVGAGGGRDAGKFYMSDGGDNTLYFGGWAQFRYQANVRNGQTPSDNNFTHGFQTQKTRLIASGTVADKNLSFEIEGQFAATTGAFGLLNAYAKYQFENGFSVRAGQFKTNLMREQNISDLKQLTADRSVMDAVFSQTRSQGVGGAWNNDSVRMSGDFTDGIGTLNTAFNAPAESDLALTGRVDWKYAGKNWGQLDESNSWRGNEYAGMVGLAALAQGGGDTGGGATTTTDARRYQLTADATVQGDGWVAFASGVWRVIDTRGVKSFNDFGFLVQGGYFVTDSTELFARYDVVVPDKDRPTGTHSAFNTLTAGVNYFLFPKSEAARICTDVVFFANKQSGSSSLVAPNINTDVQASTKSGQFGLRCQFQLIF